MRNNLLAKYNAAFNFFFSKPINEIVLGRTCTAAFLDYKDSDIYGESNEYLKRTYHVRNAANRNEIEDRICMLASICEIMQLFMEMLFSSDMNTR